MPEGHTLHRLARELGDTFGGRLVRVGSPQGRFAGSAALVDGSVLVDAEAWGKHLFIAFPGDRLVHVHLGLYGTFAVHPAVADVPEPVGQVRLRLVAPRPQRRARRTPTCAAPPPASWSPRPSGTPWSRGRDRTRSARTPTRCAPGSASAAAGRRSAGC